MSKRVIYMFCGCSSVKYSTTFEQIYSQALSGNICIISRVLLAIVTIKCHSLINICDWQTPIAIGIWIAIWSHLAIRFEV